MDVAFAVVPFADIARPAIGVSLLKAGLERRGLSTKIHYFNIEFAEKIGDDVYSYISDHTPSDSMAGEWFFADHVFPGQLPSEHEYVRNVLSTLIAPDMLRRFLESRRHRAEFIEQCAKKLKATGAPIIAFTTTFHQTCACLAIAKFLKAMPDPPVICFGGANCEGEMGMQILQSFPWVDYVCTREGDVVFPDFVEGFLLHGDSAPRSGFLNRRDSREVSYPPMIKDMDTLPIPDYDDYVDTLRASTLDGKIKCEIQIETARGCWWGARHHCTFCGLNGDTLLFRSKSPDRVFEELKYLYKRYGYSRIDSVDNILDQRYLTTVFPRLVEEGIKLEMFYEVKANLKLSQLAAMRDGGITMIQPGIESFSSQVLKIMNKGVTGAQNIQLLKWSEEVGVLPAWNILAGFPDESPDEYTWMTWLLPMLTHLEPPSGCAQIRLDRFSPLFDKAAECGLRRVRPTMAYYYVFPLGRRELFRLAYFFDFDYEDGRKPETYIRSLQNEIIIWRNARFRDEGKNRPRLDALMQEDSTVKITDTRMCAVTAEHFLSGLDAAVLLACDTAQALSSLEQRFASSHSKEQISETSQRLLTARLAIEIDSKILSLPVLRNRPSVNMENQHDALHQDSTPANPQPLLCIL